MRDRHLLAALALLLGLGGPAYARGSEAVDAGVPDIAARGDAPELRSGAAGAGPRFCLALRGNGYKVPVTLAAVARLTEEVGVADAVLGTSSGSIAAFLHENILANPAIRRCGATECSPDELARRVSLALKSMLGFADFLKTTRSGAIVNRLATKMGEGRRPGAFDLLAVLGDPTLAGMLNGRALAPSAAVLNPFNWGAQARRLRSSAGAANFAGSMDFDIFLREGLPNLPSVVELIGAMGDFYSGLGPDLTTAWSDFFGSCANDQVGAGWPRIAQRPMPEGGSCGSHLQMLARRFADEAYPSRTYRVRRGGRLKTIRVREMRAQSLDRTVGQTYPTVSTVGFIDGVSAHDQFTEMKRRYDRFAEVGDAPDWSDRFRVAYFGPVPLLERIGANERGFADLKTRRFHAVGPETWREVMVRSIGEPGLQAARAYVSPRGEAGVTVGGWVDNFGVPPLKNLGCDLVVFVTRQGQDANFASGVLRQLGADEDFVDGLFGFDADGSVGVALGAADGILCTDWDRFKGPLNSPLELASHGYESPLVTKSERLLAELSPNMPVETEYRLDGCRPPSEP